MRMDTHADKLMNAPKLKIHVIQMPYVTTLLVRTHVHVQMAGTLYKELLRPKRPVPILMNVPMILTLAVKPLNALIMMEVTAVCVTLDIMAPASNVRMTTNVIWANAQNKPIVPTQTDPSAVHVKPVFMILVTITDTFAKIWMNVCLLILT